MSEVTLHGYPVKVGDRVWSLSMPCGNGWGWVASINDSEFPIAVKFGDGNVYYYDINSPIIFWQPIDPDAIEAAKVKPKPVEYEWQWLYKAENGLWETTAFYHLESEMLRNCNRSYRTLFKRIEESKREVKS